MTQSYPLLLRQHSIPLSWKIKYFCPFLSIDRDDNCCHTLGFQPLDLPSITFLFIWTNLQLQGLPYNHFIKFVSVHHKETYTKVYHTWTKISVVDNVSGLILDWLRSNKLCHFLVLKIGHNSWSSSPSRTGIQNTYRSWICLLWFVFSFLKTLLERSTTWNWIRAGTETNFGERNGWNAPKVSCHQWSWILSGSNVWFAEEYDSLRWVK